MRQGSRRSSTTSCAGWRRAPRAPVGSRAGPCRLAVAITRHLDIRGCLASSATVPSVAASAHCRSSSTMTSGTSCASAASAAGSSPTREEMSAGSRALADAPRAVRAAHPGASTVSGAMSDGTERQHARTASSQGKSGSAAGGWLRHSPDAACTRALARATRRNMSQSAVLPMPSSPVINTTRVDPARTASNASMSAASSPARFTNSGRSASPDDPFGRSVVSATNA